MMKCDARVAQLVGGGLPLLHRQHHAEVAHRHRVAVDRAGLTVAGLFRREMRDDLMAVEIEIDPLVGTAPFRTAEQFAVELARGGEAMNRKRQMKRRQNVFGNAHDGDSLTVWVGIGPILIMNKNAAKRYIFDLTITIFDQPKCSTN